MRLRISRIVVAALSFSLLAVLPASADWVPLTPNEKVYFHCSAAQTSKVGNLDTAPASWNTTAPSQSVSSGAGCGQADLGSGNVTGGGARFVDARFAGTYVGNLDQLNVRLDNIYAGAARQGSAANLVVKLKIDGTEVLGATGKTVSVVSVPSATKASEAFQFSVKGINLMTEAQNKAHEIELYVKAPSSSVNAWVYDTTEVPGGIEFAPSTLHAATVSR